MGVVDRVTPDHVLLMGAGISRDAEENEDDISVQQISIPLGVIRRVYEVNFCEARKSKVARKR
jgi:hypothetical protein